MNPYETPKTEPSDAEGSRPDGESVEQTAPGRPCPACGSTNTTKDTLLRAKPSIAMVIFFGWVFLLIRGAFSMRTIQCHDCGAISRYKSAGSWVALWILISLILLIMVAIMDGGG